MPERPSAAETGALVHDAVPGELGVLLVQRDHPAAEALVLERTAQHAGAAHRQAVVGEAGGARVAQLRHLGQLLAAHAARHGREEAGRHERLAAGPLAERLDVGGSRDRSARCWPWRGSRNSLRRRRRGSRSRRPPRPRDRAFAGGRGGRRRRGRRAGPPASTTSASPASAAPGAASSAIRPSRITTSWAASIPATRVEHGRPAQHEIAALGLAEGQRLGDARLLAHAGCPIGAGAGGSSPSSAGRGLPLPASSS